VVTHYRLKADPDNKGKLMVDPKAKLDEELIVRPTSEAIIWNTYKGWIQSWRDLPLLINHGRMWCVGKCGPDYFKDSRISLAGRAYCTCNTRGGDH